MSSVPPKRGRSKRCKHACKPQQLKLSFGSSSGASGSMLGTMKASISEMVERLEMKRQQAQVEDDYWYSEGASGNATGWSPHKCSMQDFEGDSPEASDNGPDPARGQEEVGDHHLDAASGDATGRSSSHRQDFQLDSPKVAEDGADSVGLKEEEEDPPEVAEVLTETGMADIVRRVREFLEERGPSQEEELCCQVVGPKQAALLRASFGSLAACLAQQPGFHHTCEGDYSFLYYLDDKEEEDSRSSTVDSPPLSPTSASGLFPADSPEDGPAEAREVAEGDDGPPSGYVSSSCSSSTHASYVSALDEWEVVEERRDACTQTPPPGEEETPSCCLMHGARDTHDGQTQTCCLDTTQLVEEELRLKKKIRVLEAKIVSLEDDHNREIRELRLQLEGLLHCGCQQALALSPLPGESSQQEAMNTCATVVEEARRDSSANGGGVTGVSRSEEEEGGAEGALLITQPVVPGNVPANNVCAEEADGSHAGSSPHSGGGGRQMLTGAASKEGAAHTEEQEERLPSEPVAERLSPAEDKNGGSGLNAECPQVPDMVELHWRLEQLRGNTSMDLESVVAPSGCGSSSSMRRRKSQAQITKIVKLLKKKLPHCSEADIRSHLGHVRRLRGGFSCLTLRDIVDLVLRHVTGKEEQEGER